MIIKSPQNAGEMAKLHEIITDAYFESRPIILTPNDVSNRDRTIVGASAVGGCPLKEAFKKEGIPMDFPDAGNSRYSKNNMRRGNYSADLYVEPWIWAAQNSVDLSGCYEKYVTSNGRLTFHGFIDLYLEFKNGDKVDKVCVEIKDSAGKGGKKGEPRLSHVLQLMCYMHATKTERGFLLINGKQGWDYYEVRKGISGGFMLWDENERFYRPSFGQQWNNEATLNYKTIQDRLQTIENYRLWLNIWCEDQLKAANVIEIDFKDSEIPLPKGYENPYLNRTLTWECLAFLVEGKILKKETRNGIAIAACKWAGKCHGIKTAEPFEYVPIPKPKDEDEEIEDE